MSDFESKLTDALSSGAEGAPDATGLVDGARRRSRRRRATFAGMGAAVVLAVAVPVGVVALNDGGSDRDSDSGVAEDTPSTPDDTRIETWHDVSVTVPASWGYGARSSWCAGGEAELPVVERPGAVVNAIRCEPGSSFGVTLGVPTVISPAYESGEVWQYEAGDNSEYVPGSWLGYWYDDTRLVQVNAADEQTVRAVLDSVEVVDSVDANGCPVTRQEGYPTDAEQMSVCRYDAGGGLEQSERLSAADTAQAIAALSAAPASDPEMPASCAEDQPARLVVNLISASINSEVTLQAPCPYSPGITSGGESFQELTADVLYWALSPGWTGSVAGEVPLPDPLRTLSTAEPTDSPVEASPCPDGNYANSDFRLDADNGEPMTVCRMEVDWDGESGGSYLLADTTELTQSQSDDVRAAVEAAPVQRRSVALDCAGGKGEFFLVLAGDAVPLWVYNGECGEMTVVTSQGLREPTARLLAALGSPYGLLR